jgi:hypothetical protein
MPSNDPTIATFDPDNATNPNGCLYISDAADKAGQYWLSPYLVMQGADQGLIIPGAANTTLIRCGWNGGCSIPGGGELGPNAIFDLFITNAGFSLVLEPNTSGLTTLASRTLAVNSAMGYLSPGDVFMNQVGPWDPDNPPSPPKVGHGHECLIARIYPDSLKAGNFPNPENIEPYIATDYHYAQHNCWVGPSEGKFFRIQIGNGNPLQEPQAFAIQAVPDINPSQKVLAAALGALQQVPGFKQISNKLAPGPAKLDVSGLPRPHESLWDKIEDWIEKEVRELIEDLEGKSHKAGGAHARAEIAPKSFGKFSFSVDISGAKPGDAYLYHISQVNGKGQPYGGATVALVVT